MAENLYPGAPRAAGPNCLTLRQRLKKVERLLLEDIRLSWGQGFGVSHHLTEEYTRLYAETLDRGQVPEDDSLRFHATPAPHGGCGPDPDEEE